jgi:hypothetical protein
MDEGLFYTFIVMTLYVVYDIVKDFRDERGHFRDACYYVANHYNTEDASTQTEEFYPVW